MWARYEPLFLHTTKHAPVYEAEAAFLGLTQLQQYAIESTLGVNLGEARAYSDMVQHTLLDGHPGGGPRKPVRVQVGWDANDYQIDIGTEDGRAEYKRMIDRDSSLGITHAIFAPQNSRASSRPAAVDAWGWEEALWFSLGQQIRKQKWSPSNRDDKVPEP